MGEKIDAIVLAVGGGSQSVGALTVVRQIEPDIRVYGVQAAGASAIHDSWHAGEPRQTERADTFAGGLATRMSYDLTFGPLCEGLTDFITVTDAEIAAALRLFHEQTNVAPEGAGAAGIAGIRKLGSALAGRTVLAVISGANISEETLARVLAGEI